MILNFIFNIKNPSTTINSIYSFRIIEVDLIDNLKSDCNLSENHKSRILECYKKYINVKKAITFSILIHHQVALLMNILVVF